MTSQEKCDIHFSTGLGPEPVVPSCRQCCPDAASHEEAEGDVARTKEQD